MKTFYTILIMVLLAASVGCNTAEGENTTTDEDVVEATTDENTPITDTTGSLSAETETTIETTTKISEPEVKEVVEKTAPPKKRARIAFSNKTYQFGTISQGDKVSHDFTFRNTGDAPLLINNATASCGCTRPEYPFIPIEPGKSGTISVTFNSTGKIGNQRPTVTVSSNAGTHKLYLEGFVQEKKEAIVEETVETN